MNGRRRHESDARVAVMMVVPVEELTPKIYGVQYRSEPVGEAGPILERSLYSAVNRRRFARSTNSGSGSAHGPLPFILESNIPFPVIARSSPPFVPS